MIVVMPNGRASNEPSTAFGRGGRGGARGGAAAPELLAAQRAAVGERVWAESSKPTPRSSANC